MARAEAVPAPVPGSEAARAQVADLNLQYIVAARIGDFAWFRDHLAEEAIVILGSGRRMTRPEFLETMRSEPRVFRSLTVRDVRVRVFGAVAQVDADAPWELESGQRGVSRYIDTWAWLDGRWQVISAQVTLLPPPEP